MKATERRADKWRAAHGVDQTEIDALATLRPDVLGAILRDALDHYYDHTLARRVTEAHLRWREEAQVALEAQLDPGLLDRIRGDAEEKLADLEEQAAAINDALRIDVGGIELPEFEAPTPADRVYGSPSPLIDSAWGYARASRALIARKTYEHVEGDR